MYTYKEASFTYNEMSKVSLKYCGYLDRAREKGDYMC